MSRLTAQRVINELMKIPAVKAFYSRCDLQTMTKMALICNSNIDIDDDESIEGAIATWASFGMMDEVNDKAIEEIMKSSESSFKMMYYQFKANNALLCDKAARSIKKHIREYRASKAMEDKLMHSAQLLSIYLAIMLSARSFFVSNAQ